MLKFNRQHEKVGLTSWTFGFIAKGAYGPMGGHWHCLGVSYRWNQGLPRGWSKDRSLGFWGLLAIINCDTEGGTLKTCDPEWRINFLKIDFKAAVKPASLY